MSMNTNIGTDATNSEGQRTPRILVPLDGSELAAKALPIAETLCRQLSAQLDLVSVVPYLVLPYIGSETYIPSDVYQQIEDDRLRAARQHLEHAAATAREHGIQVQTHLRHGDAVASLLDFVRESRSELIVMTTHGRTGLARFALGSVADRVVRSGEAPVLLFRSFAPPTQEQTLSHALIPLDGSALAEVPVFSLVPLLAGPVLRLITLMRVTDLRDGVAGEKPAEDYLNGLRQRLIERLKGRDCDVNQVVYEGANPAETIVGCTSDGAYDLVLMATHGEAGVGRWAFGGVTDRVLRDGQTPLLLVHPLHTS